jgi:hypothetical protein
MNNIYNTILPCTLVTSHGYIFVILSLLFLRSKQKPADFLLCSYFNYEDGDIFLRYAGWFQQTTWRYVPQGNILHIFLVACMIQN